MSEKRLTPRKIERISRVIHPGCWAVEEKRPLSTLLGSCVAVCLFDPLVRVGGLNHFMLPNIRRSKSAPADSNLSGDVAMHVLLDALLENGAVRENLQAKAFGGGAIQDVPGPFADVGQRNARFAEEWLRQEGISLLASDLLGPWSRKIVFLPDSGVVYCRRMATGTAIVSDDSF
jgi:chemotaxis protein CheD